MEERTNKRLLLAHVIFWLMLYSVPMYFHSQLIDLPTAFVRTALPFAFMLALAYFNILGIIPYLFKRKKFQWYLPLGVYVVTIPFSVIMLESIFNFAGQLTNMEVSLLFEVIQDGKKITLNEGNSSYPHSLVALNIIFILFISSLYGLAREVIRRQNHENNLKAENLKNELKLLRRQINPHFLFNAMNNLYAIVQLKPEKAGEFVLKLSDMLRYVTYDCQHGKVAIKKEIDYLNNYVYFQKWRDLSFNDIEILIKHDLEQLQIEPMLLIPFVENAFKHSYDTHNKNNPRWIKIRLESEGNNLIFEVSNSLSSSKTQEEVADEYMGIGIENVRKRLTLLYKQKHQLKITKTKDSFHLLLSIELA